MNANFILGKRSVDKSVRQLCCLEPNQVWNAQSSNVIQRVQRVDDIQNWNHEMEIYMINKILCAWSLNFITSTMSTIHMIEVSSSFSQTNVQRQATLIDISSFSHMPTGMNWTWHICTCNVNHATCNCSHIPVLDANDQWCNQLKPTVWASTGMAWTSKGLDVSNVKTKSHMNRIWWEFCHGHLWHQIVESWLAQSPSPSARAHGHLHGPKASAPNIAASPWCCPNSVP